MGGSVQALCVGQPRPFRGDELSSFVKHPVQGLVAITQEGLAGDAQADRKHHGGAHMALHVYPEDHRLFWLEKIGPSPLLDSPGFFGTNIAVNFAIDNTDQAPIESTVFLGDLFTLGTAVLEVSQPRMPCWKIEHHFAQKGMIAHILASGRCGWYFRVIEQGEAEAGDQIERIETGNSQWSIAQIIKQVANPSSDISNADLEQLWREPLLGPSWREMARLRLAARGGQT